MAELLLLGVTHYPPLALRDEDMAGIGRTLLADPAVPAEAKDPANWPEAMRAEWGDDEAPPPRPPIGRSWSPGSRRPAPRWTSSTPTWC